MILPPGEEPVVRPWYLHMMPEDAVIWTRWLQQHADEARRVWYDLHVGEAMALPVGVGAAVEAIGAAVSRKRIDVVLLSATTYWVCEVKPYASYTALGQALMYMRLFAEEYNVVEGVRPAVICAAVDPDIRRDLERYGVRAWEVGYG